MKRSFDQAFGPFYTRPSILKTRDSKGNTEAVGGDDSTKRVSFFVTYVMSFCEDDGIASCLSMFLAKKCPVFPVLKEGPFVIEHSGILENQFWFNSAANPVTGELPQHRPLNTTMRAKALERYKEAESAMEINAACGGTKVRFHSVRAKSFALLDPPCLTKSQPIERCPVADTSAAAPFGAMVLDRLQSKCSSSYVCRLSPIILRNAEQFACDYVARSGLGCDLIVEEALKQAAELIQRTEARVEVLEGTPLPTASLSFLEAQRKLATTWSKEQEDDFHEALLTNMPHGVKQRFLTSSRIEASRGRLGSLCVAQRVLECVYWTFNQRCVRPFGVVRIVRPMNPV